jgi:predicted DNA binding CopG/RHH family protein
MKKLTKAELDAAEAVFAREIYKDRAAVSREANKVMDALIAGSSQITIRLDNSEIHLAKQQAAAKGLRYQTYIKMLLHEALARSNAA